ncbi:MAG: hypothetical protein H7A41_06635 [Chlamydiales bacterium]|nr:hypothetical protein [Chlamydiia bacterium]MCP5504812.1 hypothetical protein [Chlamydiales bacterium]
MRQGKKLAEESEKTKKTREKLRKRLEEIDQGITPQALKRKSSEIHRWIARHASDRIALRTKSISLFDENQNTASLSQKVNAVMERLKELSS